MKNNYFCLTSMVKSIKEMNNIEKEQIIKLIHREVIPAIGCTEPIAVALASAKAAEILGQAPETIEVFLSANILKNAMRAGCPDR